MVMRITFGWESHALGWKSRGKSPIGKESPESMEHWPRERRPALVLSGGALLGAMQVGVLKVLFDAGFQPSIVVGTSVGALNGAFVAFHPDANGIAKLEAIWRRLRASRVFDRNVLRVALTWLSRGNCIFANDTLKKLVCEALPVDDFSAASVPLYITATNLTKGEKAVLQDGPVSDAVLASAAIPGLFCPVDRDGDLLVDGALTADLDIETAVNLGAREILAIDLTQPPASFRSSSIPEVLNRSLELLLRQQVLRDIERFSARADITVIRPRLEHGHSLASFGHISHLIDEGERLGRQLLEGCLDSCGRLTCGLVTN